MTAAAFAVAKAL